MDWVDLGVQTAAAGVAIYIGRLIGRREERRKVPAPVAADPAKTIEPRYRVVEVGILKAYTMSASSDTEAADMAIAAYAQDTGINEGRIAAVIDYQRVYAVTRAPLIVKVPTTSESP